MGDLNNNNNEQLLKEIDQLKAKIAELEESQIRQKSLEGNSDISFRDLFNIKDIQRLQDEFSAATGVASIITDVKGVPITKASNFTNLCNNIIRKTKKGVANCYKSDAMIGKLCIQGPTIQPCLSGGLWDAGAGISVDGKHIANWLIGQVRDEAQTEDQMLKYAKEIGADESAFLKAFQEVPSMSHEKFEKIAKVLFTISNQLSDNAYKSIQKSKYIAEQKEAEEALCGSNEKYLNLMASLGTGVVLHAPDTSIILSNPMASEILGISSEQMKGKKAIDPRWRFVREDGTDMPLEEYPVNKVLKLMKSFSGYSIGINRPDRKYITWANVNASIVFDENKKTKYVTISFNDTTEQKQAELALKESEEKLNLIINASPIGICTVDPLGNFSMTNPAYERMVGYSKEECRSLSFFDVTHPNDRPKNKKLFQSMFSLEATGFSMNKRYIRKDGSEIDVAVHAIGVMDVEGNVKFGTAFADDITERKQAENTLQKTHAKHSAMIENIGDVIAIVGVDGLTKYQSPNIEKLFGWKPEDLIGANGWDLIHPEDIESIQKEYNSILNKETASLIEYRFKCKDGNYKWIELTAVNRINDPTINGVLLNYHDITERKHAEEVLKESEEKLIKMKELLGETEKTAKIGGWVVDLEKMTQTWTEETYRLHEVDMDYEPDVSKGVNFYAPSSRPIIEKAINNTVETGEPFDLELEFITAKGNKIWVHSVGKAHQENGVTKGLSGSFQDITDRKLAEEKLLDHRDQLEQLVKERTAEVDMKNQKLLDQMKVFVGREQKIRDLEMRLRAFEGE